VLVILIKEWSKIENSNVGFVRCRYQVAVRSSGCCQISSSDSFLPSTFSLLFVSMWICSYLECAFLLFRKQMTYCGLILPFATEFKFVALLSVTCFVSLFDFHFKIIIIFQFYSVFASMFFSIIPTVVYYLLWNLYFSVSLCCCVLFWPLSSLYAIHLTFQNIYA
jgi:hypothetical protein